MSKSSISAFSAEVYRVVKSPYPTQLKTLHDLVRQTAEADICIWARSHRCLIPALAQILSEGLSQWPYVLDIITRLSCAAEFRDAVVDAEPLLLDQVLARACDLHNHHSRYLDASIALLSHEIPGDVALPASAQRLLVRLFERAAARPDAETIQPIHGILYGACHTLIGVLPDDVLCSFEQHLFTILRNTGVDDHDSLNLYCLSIMKRLLQSLGSVNNSNTSGLSSDFDHSRDRLWRPDAMAQFFTGSKTHKTLQLIALRVIWACRTGDEKFTEQALAGVTLANEIVAGLSPSVRSEWRRKNSMIVQKLQDKCAMPGLAPTLRFHAITFLAALSDGAAIPPHIASTYGTLLLSDWDSTLSQRDLSQCLAVAFERLSLDLPDTWWEDFAETALDWVLDSRKETKIVSMDSGLAIIGHLTRIADDSARCRRAILGSFGAPMNRRKVEYWLHEPLSIPENLGFCDGPRCPTAVVDSKAKLSYALCSLLLRGALARTSDEVHLPKEFLPCLLSQHASLGSVMEKCQKHVHTMQRQHPVRTIIEIESTPEIAPPYVHWKQKVAATMQSQIRNQEKALLDCFSEICQDLERRCESVEGPLQTEREKFAELQFRHDDLGREYGDLEQRVMDRELRVSALESENERNVHQLEHTMAESGNLLQRIEQLSSQLRQTQDHVRQITEGAKQERHTLELANATSLACKQEELDQVREQMQQTNSAMQQLRSEVDASRNEAQKTNEQYDCVVAELAGLKQQVHDKDQQVEANEEDRQQLLDAKHELEAEMQKLRDEVLRREREEEALKAELDNAKQEHELSTREALVSYEEAMARANREWLEMKADLEKQLGSCRQELQQQEAAFQDYHMNNKQKTSELRKRIDRLTKECSNKSAEVADAQEMRNRLMNAMGLAGGVQPPVAQQLSVLPYRSASTATSSMATPKPSLQPVPTTPAHRTDLSEGDDDFGDNSFASSTSSTRGDPTPKRACPRPFPTADEARQPRTGVEPRSARSTIRMRSAMKRPPLRDLPANRSPAKDTRSPSKVAFKQAPPISTADKRELEEWSFNGASILTGTPGDALKQGNIDEWHDGTTADF